MASPAAARSFEVALGGVHDARGAHLGGAALTFTRTGTPDEPPGPPTRVLTNKSGQFQTKLAPGDDYVAVILDAFAQEDNTDNTSVITVSRGRVNHYIFVPHPPSPCWCR